MAQKMGKAALAAFMALAASGGVPAQAAQLNAQVVSAKATAEERQTQRRAVRAALGFDPGHGIRIGGAHGYDPRMAIAHRLPAHKHRVLRRRGCKIKGGR